MKAIELIRQKYNVPSSILLSERGIINIPVWDVVQLMEEYKRVSNITDKPYCCICNNCGSLFTELPEGNYCPICKNYSVEKV